MVKSTMQITRQKGADITSMYGTLTHVVKEVVAKKRAEKALRISEERYRTMIEHSNDMIWTLDKQGNFTYFNKRSEEISGQKQEEWLGKSFAPMIPPENLPGIKEIFLETLSGKSQHYEVNVDGSISKLTIFRDITERKRVEEERERLLKELEAKNRELNRFTYTVSHDLRSPLATIQGFTDMVQNDLAQNEPEKAKDNLAFIEHAATKMDRLLRDTLKLSRIGRATNPPEDVPFGEIVKDALEQTAGEINSNNIEVSVAEDFPTVHVDRMRIAEVLVNLIVNSIHYSGE